MIAKLVPRCPVEGCAKEWSQPSLKSDPKYLKMLATAAGVWPCSSVSTLWPKSLPS